MWCRRFGPLVLVVLAGLASADPRHTVPREVNLIRDFQKFGILPRVQGDRDTCSLFAITALAEFESARNSQPPHPRLSEEFLTWAAKAATAHKQDQAMFYEAVQGLNRFGICAEAEMPYEKTSDPKRKPSAAALADAKERSARWQAHWIKRWDLKRPLDDKQMQAIEEALATGHPVACGFRWPKTLRGHEILEVPTPDKVFDSHSIVLVGYEKDDKHPGGGVFRFRNSDGPGWGDKGYGLMSFAYARAYANDALWLHFGAANSEVPSERFEAEALPVLNKSRCDVNAQDMGQWGGLLWSQGKQLFCGAQEGGFVTLGFTVGKAGRYRVRVLATAAPDFATIRANLDGKRIEPDFDLYGGRVSPAGSLELGLHDLDVGEHRLRFTAVGKNSVSANYHFGLDAIDLIAAK